MAGLAETCSHVGALLYWVETAVRIRDDATCTSKPNSWSMPAPVSEIPHLRLKDIRQESPIIRPETATEGAVPSEEDKASFFCELAACRRRPVILSLIHPFNSTFLQSTNHLPKQFNSFYNPKHLELDHQQLVALGKTMEENITMGMQEHLLDVTRGTRFCKKWYMHVS